MKERIERYLREQNFDSRNGKLSRKNMEIIAEHFGGQVTSSGRYLKIDGVEYQIQRNAYSTEWEVQVMTWDIGDDWRFFSPY